MSAAGAARSTPTRDVLGTSPMTVEVDLEKTQAAVELVGKEDDVTRE